MGKERKEKKDKKSGKSESHEDDEGQITVVETTPAKKSRKSDVVDEIDLYDEKLEFISPIAKPLAQKKLNKKLLKCVRKATKTKAVKRGVKEVVKALRKNEVGLVILAGDISPIDVISHIPVLCEDHNIPYIFTPSKEELGSAGQTKRPTSVVMIVKKSKKGENEGDWTESYEELRKEVLKADECMT
ncbi:H/ACA ribonucleoprotein complex subunit 2 [Neolecta irregularis DAH-3]|uniref:H/ACA ribonucleoprotein complex subunit 2 n=1 Tax=Neolecta irregularis (strain DAH-3) TaxID=1198029 RepID=A0A1U7LN71_NEOID|nr:H/ACA ribonucleoprotein complex subunit 2 [Neolecta irregularis DAH-3]|eukprot:OLL24120.1 H/ACA ribonucleoprotein complex subunit 2 [Neolecta irregularis DAH-3]